MKSWHFYPLKRTATHIRLAISCNTPGEDGIAPSAQLDFDVILAARDGEKFGDRLDQHFRRWQEIIPLLSDEDAARLKPLALQHFMDERAELTRAAS